MKKLLYIIFSLPIVAIGQTPNYIKTTSYKTATATSISNPTATDAVQVITYSDGLGRPIQTIAGKQSGTGTDIVTFMKYDTFGREAKEYLPYPSTASDMLFVNSAETNTANYYQTNFSETNPFKEKLFEFSPVDRITKKAAPGTAWAMGGGHEVKMEYQTNTATEVKFFKVVSSWSASLGLYSVVMTQNGTTNYAANLLYKTITKNENWSSGTANTVENFRDKESRLILKRTYATSDVNGSAVFGTHDTYYVYDQFGNLTYIIPPNADGSVTQTTLDNLCYQYKYDYRNRLVEKKLPGKQWEFLVYDKLDRIVATGPAFSPFTNQAGISGWLITKYDVWNRPILTGWMQGTPSSAERLTLQNARSSATVISETKNTSTVNSTVPGDIIPFRYSNSVVPTTNYFVLTVNYYDDYNFPNAPTIPTTVLTDGSQAVFYNTTIQPKGLLTGAWVRVLETTSGSKVEKTYTLFDSKARAVRINKVNYLGGATQTDYKLDFSGKVLYTEIKHRRLTSDNDILVKDIYSYTPQDRLLMHSQQINGSAANALTKNEYDALGQLVVKRVGGSDITGNACLQKEDYKYNIRGWLTDINDISYFGAPFGGITQSASPFDLFDYKINYNTVVNNIGGNVTALYNGNISEIQWRTFNDYIKRRYGYQYDELNRLKQAIYQKPDDAVPVTNSYNETATYDKNGNIRSMQRTGEYDDALFALQMDNLVYTYHPDKLNQLLKVTDSTNNTKGFSDGTNSGDDYIYDPNGNLLSDANKKITSITYNHLNLPVAITFDSGSIIEYLYDAVGMKKQKKFTFQGATVTTQYLEEGFQYSNGILDFFPTSEGYVEVSGDPGAYIFNYAYNYLDQVGNVRLTYGLDPATQEVAILQENNYYPFGLKHANYNINKKLYTKLGLGNPPTDCISCPPGYQNKFQGQEFQNELGLNWYSFKWRNYDPAIGRFVSIDPLGEKYNWQTAYSFGSNQVVHSRELEGLEAEDDYNINDETDQNLYLDHTGEAGFTSASFDGGYGPMDGALKEVVVSNEYSAGFDKYGQLDRDDINEDDQSISSKISTFTNYAAVATIVVGLGPEDPVADAAAIAEEVVGQTIAGIFKLGELAFDVYVGSQTFDSFAKKKSKDSEYGTEAEHKKGARASTRQAHEEGQARKGKDKGGEKGDSRRTRYK